MSQGTRTNPAPFQAFLDQYRQPVLGFLRAMVGLDDADDCFQETFMAAMRAYDAMDGAHPRAWVMTIARRKAIDFHRARARRPEPRGDLSEAAADDGGLARVAAGDAPLWAAVGGLPEAQREAVALRFGADLAYREIGVALDCSEAAARRRVADALGNLRRSIDREEATR